MYLMQFDLQLQLGHDAGDLDGSKVTWLCSNGVYFLLSPLLPAWTHDQQEVHLALHFVLQLQAISQMDLDSLKSKLTAITLQAQAYG